MGEGTVETGGARTTDQWEPLRTIEVPGMKQGVRGIAFSADGRLLASGDADRKVRLWDWESGDSLPTPGDVGSRWEHRGGVNHVLFSPDGTVLASASDDGRVCLWDVASGALSQTLEHPAMVRRLAFSPDGRRVVASAYDLFLWDIDSGGLVRTLEARSPGVHSNLLRAVFSPDGALIACGGDFPDPVVRLWDAETGECVRTLAGHTQAANCVAFRPDGRVLASGGALGDSTVRLWDVGSGACQYSGRTHRGGVDSLAFSPDGHLLASGGAMNDGTVRLQDPTGGMQLVQVLEGHTNDVWDIVFHPTRPVLASAGWDGTVRLWEYGAPR